MGNHLRITKPLKLGLLFRTLEAADKNLFCISILAFVPFEGPSLLETEPDMWNILSKNLGKEMVIDMGMPKPRENSLHLQVAPSRQDSFELSLATLKRPFMYSVTVSGGARGPENGPCPILSP